jgi:hypothetical protein
VDAQDYAASAESRVTSIGGVIICLLPGVDVTGVDVESTLAAATASMVSGDDERIGNWLLRDGSTPS